jgi:IclR family acetate operon transcriptional repressor
MSHIPAERCLSIIELLADGARAMPLGDIAGSLDLPKSGTHRLLATLVEQGWAEQDPETGFYRLTMRLAVHGQRFYMASGVPDVCQPVLDRFARDCGEFARLAVVDGNALVWIAHAQGATSGLVYQPSDTSGNVPLFATATGKAWLATMPRDDAIGHVERQGGFDHADRYGPNAIRSIDALLAELGTTARRGYGVAINEAEPGVTAIAAVIRDAAGRDARLRAVGTVSIAGPSARIDEDRIGALASKVTRCADELSSVWPVRRGSPTLRTPAARPVPRGSGSSARPR